MDVSTTQRQKLDAFADLLRDPGVGRGMIGRADAERVHVRHIHDSLRGAVAVPPTTRDLCDLGSGGGLPGVVLAVVLPDVRVTLAERRGNRIDFLRSVVDELDLANVSIWGSDARTLPPRRFDVVTARAFGAAATAWAVAEPLLSAAGRLLYWGGSSFDVSGTPVSGARMEVSEPSEVAGSGPLVIMTRQ